MRENWATSKKIIVIVCGIVAVTAIGFLLWWRQQSSYVLARALHHFFSSTSVRVNDATYAVVRNLKSTTKLRKSVKKQGGAHLFDEGKFVARISGSFETFFHKTKPNASFNFDTTFTINDRDFPFAGSARFKEDSLYFTVLKIPDVFASMFDDFPLRDLWWKVSREQLKSWSVNGFNGTDIFETEGKSNEEFRALTWRQIFVLAKMAVRDELFQIETAELSSCLDGADALHYSGRLHAKTARNIWQEYRRFSGQSDTSAKNSDVSQYIEIFGQLKIELWIRQGSYQLCEVVIHGRSTDPKNKESFDVVIDVPLSDWNQSVSIVVPPNPIPFMPENWPPLILSP